MSDKNKTEYVPLNDKCQNFISELQNKNVCKTDDKTMEVESTK